MAKTLNDIFSNVKNFEIPEYQCEDNIHNRSSFSITSYNEVLGITQASLSFGVLRNVFQAFNLHMLIKMLYSMELKD